MNRLRATPFSDRSSRAGKHFSAATPVRSPARAEMLTGRLGLQVNVPDYLGAIALSPNGLFKWLKAVNDPVLEENTAFTQRKVYSHHDETPLLCLPVAVDFRFRADTR